MSRYFTGVYHPFIASVLEWWIAQNIILPVRVCLFHGTRPDPTLLAGLAWSHNEPIWITGWCP